MPRADACVGGLFIVIPVINYEVNMIIIVGVQLSRITHPTPFYQTPHRGGILHLVDNLGFFKAF